MAKRASNKQRVQRMALEAELTAEEKTKKKKKKKVKSTKKKTTARKLPKASSAGMKMVWKVIDPNYKTIATFPYPKKDDAEAKCEALTKRTGKDYRVRGVKVPLDQVV